MTIFMIHHQPVNLTIPIHQTTFILTPHLACWPFYFFNPKKCVFKHVPQGGAAFLFFLKKKDAKLCSLGQTKLKV